MLTNSPRILQTHPNFQVYLYQGEIHFIPFEGGKKPEGDTFQQISVSSAIQLIRSVPQKTRAPQPIQDAINDRVAGYDDFT